MSSSFFHAKNGHGSGCGDTVMTERVHMKQNPMHHNIFTRLVIAGTVRNLTLSLTGMIDSAVTGNYLGQAGLSALKLAAPVFSCMSLFSAVLSGGVSVILAKELSHGRKDNAQRIFRMTFTLLGGIALLFTLAGGSCPSLAASFLAGDADPAVMILTEEYVRYILLAALPIMMYDLLCAAALLEGENRRLILASAVIFAADVVGDLVAVRMDGGMGGIAAASAFAYLLAFLTVLTHFLQKRSILHAGAEMPRSRQMKEIIAAGMPLEGLYLCELLRPLAINQFMIRYGTLTGLAALSVQDAVSYFPGAFVTGLADASLLMAAVFAGEEDREGLKDLWNMILCWAVIAGFAIMCAGIVFSAPVSGLFASEQTVIQQAALALRLYFPGVLFAALCQASCACMQGIDRKKEAGTVQILIGLVLPVCCAFLLGRQYGDTGVYLSFTIWNILGVFAAAAVLGLCILFHKPLLQKSVQDEFRCTVASLEESAAVSERIRVFCRTHGIPGRTAVHAALCAQELADNSLIHGFQDEQEHHLEVRLALCSDDLILRVRDDGRPFDLTERYKMIHPEDPLKNIGLRMIFASADEVSYSAALHLNNVCIRFGL